jgi:hypothetical protein
MASEKIEELSTTLLNVAKPGLKPRDLIKAVRKTHPKATKKEVVRAAFHALVSDKKVEDGAVAAIHDFAITERASQDD